jgi:hypothetical protein
MQDEVDVPTRAGRQERLGDDRGAVRSGLEDSLLAAAVFRRGGCGRRACGVAPRSRLPLTSSTTARNTSSDRIVGSVDVQGMGIGGEFTATRAK